MEKKLKGQILVIVILVLFIVSTVILGIIAIVTRDVEQSLGAEEYERSYAITEDNMQKILIKYADVNIPLGQIVSEGELNCTEPVSDQYKCFFEEDGYISEITVEDVSQVENFELGKDDTFKVDLGNYTGTLEFQWTGHVAMSFNLYYKKTTGEYVMVSDFYDAGNFVSRAGIEESHPLNLSIPQPGQNRVILDLNGISNSLDDFQNFEYLNLRAMMNEDSNTSTLFSMRSNLGLPAQVRKVQGISFRSDNSNVNSVPQLISQIPLAGKDPSVLFYVLRSNQIVGK